MNIKLTGIVGKPESRYTPEGKAVLTFSLGLYTGGNKEAGYKERAWVRCEAWEGKDALPKRCFDLMKRIDEYTEHIYDGSYLDVEISTAVKTSTDNNKVNKLWKTIEEMGLTISSCENANEVIQIMLEESEKKNKLLTSIIYKEFTGNGLPFTVEEMEVLREIKTKINKIQLNTNPDYHNQDYDNRTKTSTDNNKPSISDVSVTPDVLMDIKTGRSVEKEAEA